MYLIGSFFFSFCVFFLFLFFFFFRLTVFCLFIYFHSSLFAVHQNWLTDKKCHLCRLEAEVNKKESPSLLFFLFCLFTFFFLKSFRRSWNERTEASRHVLVEEKVKRIKGWIANGHVTSSTSFSPNGNSNKWLGARRSHSLPLAG